MALTSLSAYCGINLPGVLTLRYAPYTWIDTALYDRLVTSVHNWNEAIPFIDEYDWLTMPLLHRSRSFSENPQRTEQGVHYEHVLEGVVPNLRPAVSGLLEEMEQYRYVCILTDRNGKPWLIGTYDHPMSFSAEATTGSDAGLNSYRIRFFGQSPRRMFGYDPA